MLLAIMSKMYKKILQHKTHYKIRIFVCFILDFSRNSIASLELIQSNLFKYS
jgi:hypothetical protein